jgi:hypothetical protein
MASREAKVKVINKICGLLGLPDSEYERLPGIIQSLVQPTAVVAFAVSSDGSLRSIALPDGLKATPNSCLGLSNAAMQLAQVFQTKALEGRDGNSSAEKGLG